MKNYWEEKQTVVTKMFPKTNCSNLLQQARQVSWGNEFISNNLGRKEQLCYVYKRT